MKHKTIRKIPLKLNSNFLSTPEGQLEYDNELARLQENRRRLTQFIKSKPASSIDNQRRES